MTKVERKKRKEKKKKKEACIRLMEDRPWSLICKNSLSTTTRVLLLNLEISDDMTYHTVFSIILWGHRRVHRFKQHLQCVKSPRRLGSAGTPAVFPRNSRRQINNLDNNRLGYRGNIWEKDFSDERHANAAGNSRKAYPRPNRWCRWQNLEGLLPKF